MKNHSLIALLKTFTKDEIREFSDFINSPYFNNRSAVNRMYEMLIIHYPEFDNTEISKTALFKKIFPGKKYNDSTFRVLLSGLNELALKFITGKYIQSDLPGYNLNKIKALMDRNVLSGIEKIFSETYSHLSNPDMKSIDTFFYLHLFDNAKTNFLSEKYSGIFDRFIEESEHDKGFENLLTYFYIKLLSNYINMLNIELLFNKKFEKENTERFFQSIDIDKYRKHIIIELYYYIVLMLKDSLNENYYFKVKNIFYKNLNKLNMNDIVEIFINLQNFCSRKVSNGAVEFYKEKFDIYKKELKYKTYLINGKMSPVYFMTLVSLALKLGELKWTKKFIKDYSGELNEITHDNTVFYSLALYEFAVGDFNKSQEYLTGIRFTDLYQKLDTKVLQIMIFYELNYEDSLISSLEAFRHFLSNNKLIPENKFIYYNNLYKSVADFLFPVKCKMFC